MWKLCKREEKCWKMVKLAYGYKRQGVVQGG